MTESITVAERTLLALLAHRETPTASPEAVEAAAHLREQGLNPVDYAGTPLPYMTDKERVVLLRRELENCLAEMMGGTGYDRHDDIAAVLERTKE